MDAINTTARASAPLPAALERAGAAFCDAAVERPWLFILAVGFVLRALSALFFSGAIDTEGAEYARIAQNLLAGNGYVGISTEGAQLFFPPLFPFAIAGLSLITGDAVVAGRLTSVVMGSLIVLPVYFIGLRMYGRKAAILAALLVAAHPFLIYKSTTVFCEATYLTLIFSGMCLAFAAFDTPTPRNLILAGALYGLAYLVRPEAVAFMLISAVLIGVLALIRRQSGMLTTLGRLGLLAGAFVVIAAPYVAWLSVQAGQFRIEAKSPLNIAVERRSQLGEVPLYAAFGVDELGNERGVWNQPNLVTVKGGSLGFKDAVTYLRLKTMWVVKNASDALASNFGFGSPPLFALAMIGLFALPWSLSVAACQLQLLGGLALMVVGTYFIYFNNPRFYIFLIPCFSIWAAVGLQQITAWARGTQSAFGPSPLWRSHLKMAVQAAGIVLLLGVAVGFADVRRESARAGRQVKALAEWIQATSAGPVRMLDSQTVISFHANAAHFWMPCCDEKAVLKYIDRKNVNVVVVRKSDADTFPYMRGWLENGIPDPRAKLVKTVDVGSAERILVYRVVR